MSLTPKEIEENISRFLAEDLGENGDITTKAIFHNAPQGHKSEFSISSDNESPFIVCGTKITQAIFNIFNSECTIHSSIQDGDTARKDDIIISGKILTSKFLTIERTILNILQHLSAVSTETAKITKLLEGTKIKLLDTRKTTPGLRDFQKYAVSIGGGTNHRLGLHDMFLIKDNHIACAGGITESIDKVYQYKNSNHPNKLLEIECENIEDVKQALQKKELIDIIMLDNMTSKKITQCSQLIRSSSAKIKIEVSGGCNLDNIHNYTNLDIDYISSGKITNSINAVDISADIKNTNFRL